MIEERLSEIIAGNQDLNPLVLRTKLKEVLQEYVLEFVYNHPTYRAFLFTGGTCLHRLYGLSRLSEDLDFDVEGAIDAQAFADDVQAYVDHSLRYSHMQTKVSGNGMSVSLKFPVLKQLGLVHSSSDSPTLFLRCDLALEQTGLYGEQRAPISTARTMFFVRAYDLPTMFGNKLAAFIGRVYQKGATQTVPFKGRDVFDLIWFLQESRRQNWSLTPNWPRVLALLDAKTPGDVLRDVAAKAAALQPAEVAADLRPFIEDPQSLEAVISNLSDTLPAQLAELAKHTT
jgi:predicted nucleotidyltransferase component of viral defense system